MFGHLNQPKPTFLQVPKMKPYINFIETLQNNGFWLVKAIEPSEAAVLALQLGELVGFRAKHPGG